MKTIEIITTILLLFLGVALLITIFKYPLDIFRGLFVESNWKLRILTFPIWGPVWLLDKIFEWKIFPYHTKNNSTIPQDIEYPYSDKININPEEFEVFVIIYSSDKDEIIKTIAEEAKSINDFKLMKYNLTFKDYYTFISLSDYNFYGFCYLVHNLNQNLEKEVFGYALSGSLKFYFYQDPKTLNNLIGKTDSGENFSISLYDDLNRYPELKLNSQIIIDKNVNIELFNNLINSTSSM